MISRYAKLYVRLWRGSAALTLNVRKYITYDSDIKHMRHRCSELRIDHFHEWRDQRIFMQDARRTEHTVPPLRLLLLHLNGIHDHNDSIFDTTAAVCHLPLAQY